MVDKHLCRLDPFEKFLEERGCGDLLRGPDLGATSGKAALAAALGHQRSTHLNKHKAEVLVEHTGTEYDHIAGSLSCDSPFNKDIELALDLEFGVYILAHMKGDINKWRHSQLAMLAGLSKDCAWLDQAIKSRSHPDTLKVTRGVNIGMMLVLTMMLQWPDWALPDRFTRGFPLAAVVPPSNIYAPSAASEDSWTLLTPTSDASLAMVCTSS